MSGEVLLQNIRPIGTGTEAFALAKVAATNPAAFSTTILPAVRQSALELGKDVRITIAGIQSDVDRGLMTPEEANELIAGLTP